MKTKKIRTPIIILICVLAVLIVVAAIALANIYPMLAMKPVDTGMIESTGITAIKDNKNDVFLFDSGDGYIMIDAGSDSDSVAASLNELSVSPDEIKYIFLTHTDYDHVAALSACKNAQLYMSKNEQQMIDGTVKRNIIKYNSVPPIDENLLRLVDDGQKIEMNGHTMECIDAPGHTKGSMIYLLDEKYLFTGDAFKVENNHCSLHPYTMDSASAKATISNLQAVINGSEYVITAHYGYYKANELSAD